MRIIKCDKCGKEINLTDNNNKGYLIFHNDNYSTPVDLCDMCNREFEKWLLNKDTTVIHENEVRIKPNWDVTPVPTTIVDAFRSDEPMTVRQILEKFEEWLMNKSVVIDNFKFICNGVSAIDEFLKEEGIEE